MIKYTNNDNILAVLNGYRLDNPDEIALQIARNFRRRRVEKNITRKQISEMSRVPLSSVARFERSGLISLVSLVRLAMALGYTAEMKELFGEPKFNTMDELSLIRRKRDSKRAYVKEKDHEKD